MKSLVLVIALCFSAVGQTVYSGPASSSGAAMYEVSAGSFFGPALPAAWVDNNEATDGVNCGGQCSGTGYVVPQYELTLPNTWVSGPPPGCTFHTPYWAETPTKQQMGTGLQNALNDIMTCRAEHGLATILNAPPCVGSVCLYSSTAGFVIDSKDTSLPNQFLVLRSTHDANLDPQQGGLPEPVGAGGIQDNVATSMAPGLINPDLTGNNVAYQLGTTVTQITTGGAAAPGITFPYSLANGTTFSSLSALKNTYNYLQHMVQLECTANGCLPLQLCSIAPGAPQACTSTTMSASLWAFYDLAVSLCPGPDVVACPAADNNQYIISTGAQANGRAIGDCINNPVTCTSQFAHHIHFRRVWAHGDWTDLASGTNAVADCFNMAAVETWSIVGSQCSQAIRPGAEGHAILVQGRTGKIDNVWLEGQSSGIFAGGEATAPALFGYVGFSDMEVRRVRDTFPYAWIGFQCSGTPTNGGTACGNLPDTNPYWGGAGDNYTTLACGQTGVTCVYVDSDGLTVHYISGPVFHDATSSWPNNPTFINGTGTANKYTINTMGAGTCTWPGGTGCPTTLTLKATTPFPGPYGSGNPVTLIVNSPSLVRKNCNEMKEGVRVLFSGIICENVDNSGGQDGINWANAIRSANVGANYFAAMHDITHEGLILRNTCNGFTNAGGRSAGPGNGNGVSYGQTQMSFTNVLGYNITKTNRGCGPDSFGARLSSAGQFWEVTITENSAGTAATAVATCSVTGGDCPAGPPSVGYEVFDILAGDPVYISGCTGLTAFNMPTQTVGGHVIAAGAGPRATVGSAAWTGSFNSAGVTVTYPWTATPNAVDNTGTCILSNTQGSPNSLILNHLTLITDAAAPIGIQPAATPFGPPFQTNHVFANSIVLSSPGASNAGWYNSSAWQLYGTSREGTNTETFNYDDTTMSAFKLVWPGRNSVSSQYTEYGNNPHYADSNGCTETGCNPPNASGMYFPTTDYCTGATSSAACVGFVGAMSLPSGPMPLALLDYHGYGLRSDSSFHNAASDGTDIGARIPAIDAAQTTNQYVCASPCGSPGPYRDQ